jgi:hypothetical protein
MSILGKLLIVLNLLAAGAFVYLTLENWKVRKELTTRELVNEVQLRGLPVEGPDATVAGDTVPFQFRVSDSSPPMESIEKTRLAAIVPTGDQLYGGEPVANQTAEIKRLQAKVIASIPAPGGDPQARYGAIHGYLLNLARTGAERDGVSAIFDMRDDAKRGLARRDLPLVARTPSQTAALRALVAITDLGDPQAIPGEDIRSSRIAQAREAIRLFLLGEVPHGVTGGGESEAARTLTNAVVDVFERKGDKQKILDAATANKEAFKHLADVAAEPLTDKPSIDRAATGLVGYATTLGTTETEKAGLTAVATLIRPPALNFVLDTEVDKAGLNLLNAKFDEAAAPVSGKPGSTIGDKARKIAHILYHIDAHRHADRTPAVVEARKAWHLRVSAVVGLPEYVRAAEAQATEYAEAAQRLVSAITDEESAFRAQYREQLQRVTALYTQYLSVEAQHRAQQAITAENERLKAERETERNTLRERHEQAKADAKATLMKLQETQKKLYDIQKDLRDAQAALLTLEGELRRIELPKEKDRTGN